MAINISNAQEMETLPTKFDCISHFKTDINMGELDNLTIFARIFFSVGILYTIYMNVQKEKVQHIYLFLLLNQVSNFPKKVFDD